MANVEMSSLFDFPQAIFIRSIRDFNLTPSTYIFSSILTVTMLLLMIMLCSSYLASRHRSKTNSNLYVISA
jgi:hypothetical protein